MIKQMVDEKLVYSGGEVPNSTLDWLAALAHASDDAIIGSRLDRTITYWNESATRLYGYTEAEMIGNPSHASSTTKTSST